MPRVVSLNAVISGVSDDPKTGENKPPDEFDRVGLLADEPLDNSEVLFISSPGNKVILSLRPIAVKCTTHRQVRGT